MIRRSSGRLFAEVVSATGGEGVVPSDLRRNTTMLCRQGDRHRVPGPVLATLTRSGVDAGGDLRMGQRVDAMARLTALHDLALVTEVFEAAGIEFLAFKGQVLTTLVSGDEWERPTLDLDLLVRATRLEEAVDLLVAAGAIHLDQNWRMVHDLLLGELHLMLPTSTSLDLHWHLLVRASTRGGFRPDVDALFETSRTVDLDGTPVRTFGPAETLVYSCLHAAISGGHRMVWLKDIEQLVLRDRAEWSDVEQVASDWRCSLVVGAMLMRTSDQLGLVLPAGLLNRLVPSRLMQAWFRAVDRVFPVGAIDDEAPLLRFLTRSVDVDAASSLRSMASRTVKQATRIVRRRSLPTAADLFVADPEGADLDVRVCYFDEVRNTAIRV